jgi:hypothetical protein
VFSSVAHAVTQVPMVARQNQITSRIRSSMGIKACFARLSAISIIRAQARRSENRVGVAHEYGVDARLPLELRCMMDARGACFAAGFAP